MKIFDEPLHLTEQGVLESLTKNINFLYENYNSIDDKEKMNYIANLLTQIIENNEFVENKLFKHNLYSVVVTITPWILISNKSEINLVLSFDKSIYFLESNSDFVPSKSDKPVCIGVMHENDVYWSFQFSVGQNTVDQIENSFTDVMWSFTNKDLKDEAFLQMKINVGKYRYIVPLSLKHVFIENESRGDSQYNKFYHLIIEPSVYISNCSGIDLYIEALCLVSDLVLHGDISSNQRKLSSHSGYVSINSFSCIHYPTESNYMEQFIIKLNLSDVDKSHSISDNSFVSIDLSILSTKADLDNNLETKFLFVKDIKKGSKFVNFKAFTVNSTVNFGTKKLFIDIFECKFVPIIITNFSDEIIFFDELIADRWNKYMAVELETGQSVPFWPADFQIDINKESCGNFSRPYYRFRVGAKLTQEITWTEYFPLVNIDLPSKMDMSTVDGKQNWQFIIENDICSKIHIKIYNKNHQFNEPTIKNSLFQIKTFSISQLSFSLLERSSNMETLVESVRVSVEKFNCILAKKSKDEILYEISANHLQVDNKFFSSGLYDFPVLFNSVKTQSNQSFVVIKIETNSYLIYSLDIQFHNEIELFIENIFLYDLLRLFSKFYQSFFSSTNKSVDSVLSISPFNIIRISVSRILLRLTVHAFLKIYVSCEATSLALPELTINDSALRISGLQKYFWHHYVTAVLVRCGCVLGSMELLGNPNGIFRHLTTGLTDLLSSRNIDHGLLVDFLLRLLSFCRYTSGGFISSFTGIVSSVSRNLDYFTLDDTHITRQELLRRQTQSSGVMVGFIRGLSGLALSLLGAVAGLADQPLQASQEALQANSSVSIAVIKGLGKGLIGVVTKPLSGTAELLAQTGRGFLNTTGITINRNHSDLVQFTLTSNSDIFINVSHFLNFLLNDGVMYEENTPILYWSSHAINDDQIPVYLFLTNQHLVEWHIDKPLKNDKTFHALCNYNISISSHSIYKNCLTLKYSNANNFVITQSDNRINAFISDLQYAKEVVEPITNKNSHTSSTDSTEYVKFVSVPNVVLNNQNNIENNFDTTLIHCETINFYSNHLFNGLVDALLFLRNRQDRFNNFID